MDGDFSDPHDLGYRAHALARSCSIGAVLAHGFIVVRCWWIGPAWVTGGAERGGDFGGPGREARSTSRRRFKRKAAWTRSVLAGSLPPEQTGRGGKPNGAPRTGGFQPLS